MTQMTLFYVKDCSYAQNGHSIHYLTFQKAFVHHQYHESKGKVYDEKREDGCSRGKILHIFLSLT